MKAATSLPTLLLLLAFALAVGAAPLSPSAPKFRRSCVDCTDNELGEFAFPGAPEGHVACVTYSNNHNLYRRYDAQCNLVAGDVAFVSYGGDQDRVGFLATVDIPAGCEVIFNANTWNGASFLNDDPAVKWTTTAVVPKGSVVSIGSNTDIPDPTSITASTGQGALLDPSGTDFDWSISGSSDTVYAYLPSGTFLAALTNTAGGFGSGQLTNTGLTEGQTAVAIEASTDYGYYKRSLGTSFANRAAALAAVHNGANWETFPNGNYSLVDLDVTPMTIA
ncbi:hypothetical protein DFJ74DRAFT_672974 [Hyaloraphidium curvatum]|nr:hypothetical protein DFJ74DRAFT_672974 [Hyaloraphidium curvatum]